MTVHVMQHVAAPFTGNAEEDEKVKAYLHIQDVCASKTSDVILTNVLPFQIQAETGEDRRGHKEIQ